ncbi:Agamous MADS-box protein AGL90 [Spatholobus suberectus]|nr:Agamous MADS-box protein AGL90 [Spatholobus suberectus]
MKKLKEFKTVHGMEACAIVRSVDAGEPEIWASSKGLRKALMKSAQEQQRRRMESQEDQGNLDKTIKKAKKKLGKQKEFRVHDETLDFPDPQDLTKNGLKGVLELIDVNMKEIMRKLEELKKNEPTEVQATVAAPPPVKIGDEADKHKGKKHKGKKPLIVKGGEGLEMIVEAMDQLQIK